VVRDTGPGIPDEIAESLFEPFVTCGKARGTGLGLAICRQIVEAHGGSIGPDLSADEGAVFIIELPAALDEGSARHGA
jgi:signal transduction histidine kinase